MSERTFLVIGGGFAGVAAATQLRAAGAVVTLVDMNASLGGRARSDLFSENVIDTGAQLVASSFTRTLHLLAAALAVDDDTASPPRKTTSDEPALYRTPGRDRFVRDGARFPLRFGSIRGLLSFGALGAMEKLKLGRHVLPILALHKGELDAGATGIPAALDRESARAFVERHVGARAANALVEPPLNSFYGARGRDTSLAFYLMLGRYGSASDLLAPQGGWSRILERALRGVMYERAAKVMTLAVRAGGEVVARAEDGREWSASGAIIATGPRSARTLLASLLPDDDALMGWLDTVKLAPTWTLALALSVSLEHEVFGVLRDAGEARLVSACAIHSGKLPRQAAKTEVVLAWPTPDGMTRLAGRSADEIVAAMMPEVESLVPEVRGHVTRARVYRFDEGTPLAQPGFVAQRAEGRALVERLDIPIALAGDYLTAPLIEGAVASGKWAASSIAERLRLV